MFRPVDLGWLSGSARTFSDKSASNEKPTGKKGLILSGRWQRSTFATIVLLMFTAQSFADCICSQITCCACSPIIIDVTGRGFNLTSEANGVVFDISGSGNPKQIAWTALGSTNAFLALDRNGNGVIDDGKELFGNFTDQPESTEKNGFLALAVFDAPENGGNGDGVIDARDRVFTSLRLWVDVNHDGISQPEELHTLPSLGVKSISLDFWLSRDQDRYGNRFRYRSEINLGETRGTVRVAYDVLLI